MEPQRTDPESSDNTKKINDKNKTIPLHLGMSHSNYKSKIKETSRKIQRQNISYL